jgi:hypothetical protein
MSGNYNNDVTLVLMNRPAEDFSDLKTGIKNQSKTVRTL